MTLYSATPDTAVEIASVFLDVETTGLTGADEVLQIGVVDADHHVLLETLIRPTNRTEWEDALRQQVVRAREARIGSKRMTSGTST